MNDFLELWKELPAKIHVMSPYTGNMLYVYLLMGKTNKGDIVAYMDGVGNCYIRITVQDDNYINALNQMKIELQKEGFM